MKTMLSKARAEWLARVAARNTLLRNPQLSFLKAMTLSNKSNKENKDIRKQNLRGNKFSFIQAINRLIYLLKFPTNQEAESFQ